MYDNETVMLVAAWRGPVDRGDNVDTGGRPAEREAPQEGCWGGWAVAVVARVARTRPCRVAPASLALASLGLVPMAFTMCLGRLVWLGLDAELE